MELTESITVKVNRTSERPGNNLPLPKTGPVSPATDPSSALQRSENPLPPIFVIQTRNVWVDFVCVSERGSSLTLRTYSHL